VKPFRIILLTTACVGLGLPASRADFVTVGTPNGGTRDPLFNPGTSRFQQVYSASVFGDVPILITGVAFVSNADSSFSTLVPDLAQDVSTTTASPSSLSPYLPDNVGPDVVIEGQTLFLVSKTARKNQEQSLTPSPPWGVAMPRPSFTQEKLPCGTHLGSRNGFSFPCAIAAQPARGAHLTGAGPPPSGWSAWKSAWCSVP